MLILSIAKMFCGLEIGLVIPPKLLANAIPITRLLAKGCVGGSVRKIGCTKLKHKTGAATLDIHMLAKVATSMFARMTKRGLRPTRLRMATAICFAMKCLLRADAMANPPNSNMMTCGGRHKSALDRMATIHTGLACLSLQRTDSALGSKCHLRTLP